MISNGNTLLQGDLAFSYNLQGRMKTASRAGMNAAYFYNFKGERSLKQVNGVKTRFIYDLQGQLINEVDENGALSREYIYLNGQRLASVIGGALYYVHTDHLDTPIALTDENAQIQWQASYTPFGQATITINQIDNTARFPGQYLDQETGLHYNYFRDYDPEIGRYIQSDPIGLNGGINTYGYVGGNPIMLSDPTGQCPWCIAMAIGGLTGGGLDLLTQLIQNGWNWNCVDGAQVMITAALGAGLSTLGPTGLLLGRGGARASQYGYNRSMGYLNHGNRRFGWSGPSNGRDVISARVGDNHLDLPFIGSVLSGANPIRDGTASGIIAAGSTSTASNGDCGCE